MLAVNLHHHPSFHHPALLVGSDYVETEFSSAAQLPASAKLPCIYDAHIHTVKRCLSNDVIA